MFNFLKREKKEPADLIGVLKELKKLEKKNLELIEQLAEMKTENKSHFKKMGFVRYNPFSEVGSDQSFSLALLDSQNNGVIITSLFSREGNRVYAKAIEQGKSAYPLSDEEKQALDKAQNL